MRAAANTEPGRPGPSPRLATRALSRASFARRFDGCLGSALLPRTVPCAALLGVALLGVALPCAALPAARAADRGYGLSGRVIERPAATRDPRQQRALANATVELWPELDPYRAALAVLEDTPPAPAASAHSDQDGYYRLVAPQPGLWRLRLTAPGHAPQQTVLLAYLDDEDHPNVALVPGRRVSVRVEDPQGRPVAGARVAALHDTDDEAWIETARTGEDGRLTLDAASDSPLQLGALLPGFAPAEEIAAEGGSAVLRLRPAVPRTVEIRDAHGRPVAGALVVVGSPGLPVGKTGEDGRLEIPTPAEGKLAVRVLCADLRHAETTVEPPQPEPQSQETESRTPPAESERVPPVVRLTVEEPVAVSGQVIDAEDRTPLAGAWLWAPAAGQAVTVTDAAGGYTLRLPVTPEQDLSLVAVRAGYLPRRSRVRHDQPSTDPRAGRLPTVALHPAAAIAGRVVDTQGAPVAGAHLVLGTRTRGQRGLARSGPDGGFLAAALPPGAALRLSARKAGFATATLDLPAIEPGRTLEGVRVVMERGRSVLGRVVDADEQPVAGARVALAHRTHGGSRFGRRLDSTDDPYREPEATGAEGIFELDHVAQGEYDLSVEASGFAPAEVPGVEVPAGDQPFDLGTVLLERAVAVEGRVVDPDDAPIEGARVQALPQGEHAWRGGRPRILEGVSDAQGRFSLGDLRRGETVMLRVEREGYAMSRIPAVRVPSADPLEIVLQPAAQVSGVVRDTAGGPIEGAQVLARRTEGSGRWGRGGNAQTDAEGKFTLTDLDPGVLLIEARAEGFLPDAGLHLEVAPGSRADDVEITLTRGATVFGRVTGPSGEPLAEAMVMRADVRGFPADRALSDGDGRYRLEGVTPGARSFTADHSRFPPQIRDLEVRPGDNRLDFQLDVGRQVSGRVVDASGVGVGAATLRLSSMAGEGHRASSQADGSFTFSGLGDGHYRLRASHPDHGETTLGEMLTVQGSDVTGVEVRFGSGAVIHGQVTGLGLDDLAALDIRAFGGQGGGHWTRPDFEGRFELEDLAPGTWMVLAMGPSGRQVTERVELPEGTPEAEVVLEFSPGLTLTGRVTVGSRPLGSGWVSARREDGGGGGHAALDLDGRFRIEGLEEGSYRVRVFDPGGLNHQEEVEIDSDRDLLIELAAGRVEGRILDASTGAPLPGVSIRLEADDAGQSPRMPIVPVETDTAGIFRLGEVVAGRYRLVASKEGYGRAEKPITVAEGAPAAVELALQPSQGLVLRLSWTGELLPPSRVQVTAVSAGTFGTPDALGGSGTPGRPELSEGLMVGENGTVRLRSLPEGVWNITVDSPGAAAATVRAVVPGPPVAVLLAPLPPPESPPPGSPSPPPRP